MKIAELDSLTGRFDAKSDAFRRHLMRTARKLFTYFHDTDYREWRVDLGVDQGIEGVGKTKREATEDYLEYLDGLTLGQLYDKVNGAIGQRYEDS